jgi:hypothetical protein
MISIHPAKEPLPPDSAAAKELSHFQAIFIHPAKEPLPPNSAAGQDLSMSECVQAIRKVNF